MVPGLAVVLALLGLVSASLSALIGAAGGDAAGANWSYLLAIARFTAVQAGLSTVLSLMLGAALALALARRQVPGRAVILALLGASTALPAIVVVFAVTTIYGRAGLLSASLVALGAPRLSLYGLPAILIAHVFFNASFSARVFLAALEAVPGEHWRLAEALAMPASAVFRLIDRPVLLAEAPSLALLTLLVCATSFAIPLALGGGPGAATPEVAVFEALRFDADFGRAALIALAQIAVLAALVLVTAPWLRRPIEVAAVGRPIARPDRYGPALRLLDTAVFALATGLVLPLLGAVAWSGHALLGLLDAAVMRALLTSLAVAVPSALLSLAAALMLARSRAVLAARGLRRSGAVLAAVPLTALAVPPVALAAGLYVLARRFGDPGLLALPALVVINAMMALPFVHRFVEPPMLVAAERYGRLAESLGLSPLDRLRFVEAPLLQGPAGSALAYAAALSLGDIGVVTLFGSDALVTLPALIYERLGAYRMDEAAALSALLSALVLAFFLLAARTVGSRPPPAGAPHAGRV